MKIVTVKTVVKDGVLSIRIARKKVEPIIKREDLKNKIIKLGVDSYFIKKAKRVEQSVLHHRIQ